MGGFSIVTASAAVTATPSTRSWCHLSRVTGILQVRQATVGGDGDRHSEQQVTRVRLPLLLILASATVEAGRQPANLLVPVQVHHPPAVRLVADRRVYRILGIHQGVIQRAAQADHRASERLPAVGHPEDAHPVPAGDRKSTRLNSSHQIISYAVFCLKKKKSIKTHTVNHST